MLPMVALNDWVCPINAVTGVDRVQREQAGQASRRRAPGAQHLCPGFAILPAEVALLMASLIIGPLDRTGFDRAAAIRLASHPAGLLHSGTVSFTGVAITGAWRLPAAPGTRRCCRTLHTYDGAKAASRGTRSPT